MLILDCKLNFAKSLCLSYHNDSLILSGLAINTIQINHKFKSTLLKGFRGLGL